MLGAGSWLGPVRVSLATGVADAFCDERTCPLEGDEEPKLEASGPMLPVDLEAEHALSASSAALGLALRAGLRVAWFDTARTEPRQAAFTPRWRFALGSAHPAPSRLRGATTPGGHGLP